eukprot:Opistho-2@49841
MQQVSYIRLDCSKSALYMSGKWPWKIARTSSKDKRQNNKQTQTNANTPHYASNNALQYNPVSQHASPPLLQAMSRDHKSRGPHPNRHKPQQTPSKQISISYCG